MDARLRGHDGKGGRAKVLHAELVEARGSRRRGTASPQARGMSMRNRRKVRHDRIARRSTPSLQPVGAGPPHYEGKAPKRDAVVACGWGRLIVSHTLRAPKKAGGRIRPGEEERP